MMVMINTHRGSQERQAWYISYGKCQHTLDGL